MKPKWILLPVFGLGVCGGGCLLIQEWLEPTQRPYRASEFTPELKSHLENLAGLRFPKDAELRFAFYGGEYEGGATNFKLRMSAEGLEALVQQYPFQGRSWRKFEGKSAEGFENEFWWFEWRPSRVSRGRITDYGESYDMHVLIDDQSSTVKDVYFRYVTDQG